MKLDNHQKKSQALKIIRKQEKVFTAQKKNKLIDRKMSAELFLIT